MKTSGNHIPTEKVTPPSWARHLLSVLLVAMALSMRSNADAASAEETVPRPTVQTDLAVQTTAGPARPKLRFDGEFDLESNDGVGYRLYYYFQHGGSPDNLESHVFYPPPYHLVTDEGRQIKYNFDEGENILTLWVRYANSSREIVRALRTHLAKVAVDQHQAKIIPGTNPYRISVLPVTSWHFNLTKNGEQSGKYEASLPEGDVAVHFRDVNADSARGIVNDLQSDTTQLSFQYTFSALAEETCTASFRGEGVQGIDIFRQLEGEGERGFVSRRQAAQIADDLVDQEVFQVSCPEGGMLSDLTDFLLRRLEDREERDVASWEELDQLIALDLDDFRADITETLKTVDNRVVRTHVANAMSNASSKFEKTKVGLGTSANFIDLLSAELEGNFSNETDEATATAKRAVSDALKKSGVQVDWQGWRSTPKTVDVHTVAEMSAEWASGVEFEYSLPKGQEGSGSRHLTAEDRTASVAGAKLRGLDHRLHELESIVEASRVLLELDWLAEARHVLDFIRVDGEEDSQSFATTVRYGEDEDGDPIEGVLVLTPGHAELRASDDVDIDADDDVDIDADDDVDIDADDDVDIDARDTVVIKSGKEVEDSRRDRRGEYGVRIQSNAGAPIHITTDGYLIIDARGLILNGRELRQQ